MSSSNEDERIILNVGGIKYETYKSTLAAYPNTFLGAMFQERNQQLRHPTNGNEYFFDRNGYAFRYILEFYRNGKLLLPDFKDNDISGHGLTNVSYKELLQEVDYFQIPIEDNLEDFPSNEELAKILDGFIQTLKKCIHHLKREFVKGLYQFVIVFYEVPCINISMEVINYYTAPGNNTIIKLLKPYSACAYSILDLYGDKITDKFNSRDDLYISLIDCNVPSPAHGKVKVLHIYLDASFFDTENVLKHSKELN
ncbi:hypothetical protein RhiirA5_497854 [Rhizophagus irregularis]|uniref:BTB domain-containing protein n=4 Tax=Rhizophagus irregularis TaxID=588596 RepID=A0A2I1E9S4_9GLOM|nr:BTB/POZ protein [Rhizophagus irregularis DAOM 181602=DAOM 197198]EXX71045.1 hypothetical protein RirG_081930 [Rhizophagus irregularis DAOM 197198w]PKC11218.1 hypothetical protein RhiirA5_497854 [Rhizophagus irregularis]PKC73719.1 hypothetical protein RhiirA1_437406 [Rhizophagus irregularis]PKK77213.1 hypothetical protein RhiirC2_862079 [Rhizophagus irregularis]PKY18884.1 hypothetical protein RhiirB3_523101 [Rhizophagus irregularis]|eukprot:XP_025188492.1 BTB/POZ protein [Rhizophagus irregularis DAOM 181602=DAOM 197198]